MEALLKNKFRFLPPTGTAVTHRVQERQFTGTRPERIGDWTWQTIAFCNSRDEALKIFKALSSWCEDSGD